MTTTEQSLAKNQQFYDAHYRNVQIRRIGERVGGAWAFIEDAKRTYTSWHGLYGDGFGARLSGATVFEIGAGDGLNALLMARLGAYVVVANDISPDTERIIVGVASEIGLTNIKCAVGDFAELPIEERVFDFVIGKAFLHHLTHDLEDQYLAKVARILKPTGEARFVEPAVNSKVLDGLRWLVPTPRRPSKLQRKAFANWKARDPHPDRDNSSAHYMSVGAKYFGDTQVTPIGSLERFQRWLPPGNFDLAFRRWAHRTEYRLPMTFRMKAARSQRIVYRRPKEHP